jgi:type I restriction enzyme S subunit
MASEHPFRTIGDVCYVTDGAHAKVERQDKGILYLTSKNIGVGQLLLDQVDFISHEDYERLFSNTTRSQRRPVPGDVLTGIIGTFGNAYLYRENDHFGISSAVALLRADGKQLVPKYLYYVITSNAFSNAHFAYKSGSVQGYTNIPTIKRLPIPTPSLPEQRAIAHILGTLDDKIELNRKMNETLEAMAQALFKNWFVDFEPFRNQGMEDSSLGQIPRGWRVGKISELTFLSREGVNPSDCPDEMFDHHSIPAFDEEHLPKAEIGKDILSNKFLVPSNAVLLSKLNPRFPRVWLTSFSSSRRSLCSTEFLVALPLPGVSREYLYSLFCSRQFLEIFSTLVTGTSGSHQRVKPDYLLTMDTVVPNGDTIARFSNVSKPLHARVAQNLEESQTLASIRDTLLPKLLSGEIRVKDAERFAERFAERAA